MRRRRPAGRRSFLGHRVVPRVVAPVVGILVCAPSPPPAAGRNPAHGPRGRRILPVRLVLVDRRDVECRQQVDVGQAPLGRGHPGGACRESTVKARNVPRRACGTEASPALKSRTWARRARCPPALERRACPLVQPPGIHSRESRSMIWLRRLFRDRLTGTGRSRVPVRLVPSVHVPRPRTGSSARSGRRAVDLPHAGGADARHVEHRGGRGRARSLEQVQLHRAGRGRPDPRSAGRAREGESERPVVGEEIVSTPGICRDVASMGVLPASAAETASWPLSGRHLGERSAGTGTPRTRRDGSRLDLGREAGRVIGQGDGRSPRARRPVPGSGPLREHGAAQPSGRRDAREVQATVSAAAVRVRPPEITARRASAVTVSGWLTAS